MSLSCRQTGSLTRSMLSRGLALLRMRMICLIWPWLTLLLMQPNTTRALGWRDGLYWNANLGIQRHTHIYVSTAHIAVFKRRRTGMRDGGGSYFCASSVHWSNHLQAGMSLIQAWRKQQKELKQLVLLLYRLILQTRRLDFYRFYCMT